MIYETKEIARELRISKKEVEQNLTSGLTKIWKKVENLFPENSPFERMEMIGRMLNVFADEEWPEFFYGFPDEIRLEVLEDIKENKSIFKHINCNNFMKFNKKSFLKKPKEEKDDF